MGPTSGRVCGDTSGDVRLRRRTLVNAPVPSQRFDVSVRSVAASSAGIHPASVDASESDDNVWGCLAAVRARGRRLCCRLGGRGQGLGHELDGRLVLERLPGDIARRWSPPSLAWGRPTRRPASTTIRVARLGSVSEKVAEVDALFDAVLESRVLGVRNPTHAFTSSYAALGCSPRSRSSSTTSASTSSRPGPRHRHHRGDRSRRRAGSAGQGPRAPVDGENERRRVPARQAEGGSAAALSRRSGRERAVPMRGRGVAEGAHAEVCGRQRTSHRWVPRSRRTPRRPPSSPGRPA